MKFDAYGTLAKLRAESGGRANHAIRANPDGSISTISAISTDQGAPGENAAAMTFSTNSTISTGRAPEAENVIPLSPRIAAALAEAFKDYAATDDPHDPRAWA
ncbi:hypothetical protein [Paracoccus halophilus]|uniref:hypothetical protein n=1 Tax=Paracoccus halophilus TaxID=376733 RepID=UPI001113DA28|nr:hypothetical protein [Paracoccus halophilus]